VIEKHQELAKRLGSAQNLSSRYRNWKRKFPIGLHDWDSCSEKHRIPEKIEEIDRLFYDFFSDSSFRNHSLAFQADIRRPEFENDIRLPQAHVVDAADRWVVEELSPICQRVEH
jgi:hypothetical protein